MLGDLAHTYTLNGLIISDLQGQSTITKNIIFTNKINFECLITISAFASLYYYALKN